MSVGIVDLDWADGNIDWAPLVTGERRATGALLRAFEAEAVGVMGEWTFRAALAAGSLVNKAWGGPFRDEIEAIADTAGADPGVVLGANLSYDAGHAGCTAAAVATRDGMLHFRNMDWAFPRKLLQAHSKIVRVRGAPAGDYLTLTWPGFFGALTAVAPGRFAVTVNFVNHVTESTTARIAWRAVQGYWPVPWAVRNALDTARSYRETVAQLCEVLLVSPVLLMVTGTRPGEAVVIERGVDSFALRRPRRDGSLLLTNHYLAPGSGDENVPDVEEVMYSASRLERLGEELGSRHPRTAAEAFQVLDADGILMDETQQQVVLSASRGTLTLRVPGYEELTAGL